MMGRSCILLRKANALFCINYKQIIIILIVVCFSASLTWFNNVDVHLVIEGAIRSKGVSGITDDQIQSASDLMVRSKWVLSAINAFVYSVKPLIETIVVFWVLTLFGLDVYSFKLIYKQCVATKIVYVLSNIVIFICVRFFAPLNRSFNAYLPISVGDLLSVGNSTSWLYDVNMFIILDSCLLFFVFRYFRKIQTAPIVMSLILVNLIWFAPKWLM